MAVIARPRRSVLYMPGSNARALEKGRSLPADGLILDLEDAVAPDAKDTARDQIVAALAAGGYGKREIQIRTNGLNTPWGYADIVAAAKTSADAILRFCHGDIRFGQGFELCPYPGSFADDHKPWIMFAGSTGLWAGDP